MRLLLAGLVGMRYVDEELGTFGKVRKGAESPPQVRLKVLGPLERTGVDVELCAGVEGL